MIPKLLFPTTNSIHAFLVLIILFLCSTDINAQCAGNDNINLSVCDITNPSSKSIDLYAQLGGSPTAGGTWTDNDNSGGLNTVTGILNAQLIKESKVYHYTYTVNGVSGCADNTAVITVTIGGYTGVPAPTTSICSSETAYNLFQVFEGIPSLSPQIGGTWHDDNSSGGLNTVTGILNAKIPFPNNTYSYTYSIAAIGSCPAPPPSKIFISIYRSPEPGTPTNLATCSNQLSSYTNLDLNTRLSGADPGGTWTESTTSEISGIADSSIDVQNIYNTKGPGTYLFTYTVNSNNTVCTSQSSNVYISIGKQLDFTGATLIVNPDVCENDMATTSYTGILTQGVETIANGSYRVDYTIAGVGSFATTQNFINGVLAFPIPSVYFSQVKDYVVSITNVTLTTSPVFCSSIIGTIQDVLHISPSPKINNATLTINPVCQTFDAVVNFSGTSNLSDGNYDIIYNLSGSNSLNGIPASLIVTGGLSSFNIPAAYIPKVGTTTITITKITNSSTGCTNTSTLKKDFTINPSLDMTNLAVTIKDICQGQPATIKLSGLGTLTTITITYDLSGVNTVGSQTIPLTVVSGQTSLVIPTTDIPNVGLTSFNITNITNSITGCSLAMNKKTNFTVIQAPNIPVTNDQFFCSSDNATVANLIPQGSQYQWFDSVSSTVPLASTTPLVTGNYFVKEVSAITSCESGLKMINVQNNPTPQINGAILSIASVCQSFEVKVDLTGNSNLADGNYNILYNLSGSNIANTIPAVLSVANKFGSFIIPKDLVPNAGTSTVAITKITNPNTGCFSSVTLSKSFTVNPLPDTSQLKVTIKDVCQGQPANIKLSGLGTLTTININYSLTGANSVSLQTISLIAASGEASFTVPTSDVPNLGLTTFTMTDITNTVTGCPLAVNIKVDFTVNSVPIAPVATDQKFCGTDNATVGSLLPKGSQYQWFDSLSSTTPLSSGTLLITGNYYVKEVNSSTGCNSGATPIAVTINNVPIPVLKPDGQNLCGVDKPTIQSLSDNTDSSGNLTWYDAAINGTALANTYLLIGGATYYGFDYNPSTQCYSNPLPVTVSLTNCTATADNFFIPDGFSPNGDNKNDTFQIIDIEFLFPNYTLEIFNRYGNVLFKGDINKPAWDGKNSNSNFINGDAPTGVYFYIINYNKDNLPPKQGQLYLSR